MTTVEYRHRASVIEKSEAVWRTTPGALERVSEGGAVVFRVPYANIRSVRLAFAPGRFQTGRFLMELTGARSQLTLTNLHFKGFADFEDRSDTFFPLIREVVRGVAAANPEAKFQAGEQPALYLLLLAFALGSLALLALVVAFLPIAPGNVSLSAVLKLGLIAFSLPLLLSWAVNARPRRFDPHTGLEAVLKARSA